MITLLLRWGTERMHFDLLSNLPERVCSLTPTPPRWGDLTRNRAWLQSLIKASSEKQASSWVLIFLPHLLLLCLPSASTKSPFLRLPSIIFLSFPSFACFFSLSTTLLQVRCCQLPDRRPLQPHGLLE